MYMCASETSALCFVVLRADSPLIDLVNERLNLMDSKCIDWANSNEWDIPDFRRRIGDPFSNHMNPFGI